MNILYIGGGFVGACSAAVSADSGHKTLVYDIDSKKIEQLGSKNRDIIEQCLFEDGLGDILVRNSDRIRFTDDYTEVSAFLDDCDAVFMCLPTPEIDETGESDLGFYKRAAAQLGQALKKRNEGMQEKYVVIVNKSTVPIDMADVANQLLEAESVKNFGVVSNPEFLVESKAIEGSIRPDRVVVGATQEKDFEIMRRVYQRFYDSATVQYLEVTPREAEAGKLLANYYLFMKIVACFDVIGRVAETFDGIHFENVRSIITADKRISNWGFYNSLYAGGSCLIKDARSLSHQLQTAGKEAVMVNEVYLGNKRQLEFFLSRFENETQMQWDGKKVVILGLSFKQNTNDVRNSPSFDIVRFLLDKSVGSITLSDPIANEPFKQWAPQSEKLHYVLQEKEAIKDADVVIIATDWPQYKSLVSDILELENRPIIMDGRRMLSHRYEELRQHGCSIIAVGSPFLKA